MTEYRRQCVMMDRFACPCCRGPDATKRQIRRIAKKRERRFEKKMGTQDA